MDMMFFFVVAAAALTATLLLALLVRAANAYQRVVDSRQEDAARLRHEHYIAMVFLQTPPDDNCPGCGQIVTGQGDSRLVAAVEHGHATHR
jgi:hypothetical protein